MRPQRDTAIPHVWRSRRTDPNVSLDLWEILAEEFESYGGELPGGFDDLANAAVSGGKGSPAAENATEELFSLLNAQPRTALCFSGGGVRSATFGMGVLQGLATCACAPSTETPLAKFDYLSTVSGGGYVGSWFSAWAQREEKPGVHDGPQKVERILRQRGGPLDPDPAPLSYVRRYCAFLDPKLGLLSADTWTLASTVLRNMFLNWLILIPFLMALVLLPKMYRSLLHLHPGADAAMWLLYCGTALGIIGTAYISSHLPAFSRPSRSGEGAFIGWALIPLTLTAALMSLHWHWMHTSHTWNYPVEKFLAYGALLHGAGWVAGVVWLTISGRLATNFKGIVAGMAASLISGVIAGGIAYLIADQFNIQYPFASRRDVYLNWYATLGLPAVLCSFLMAAVFLVGAVSKITGDDDREWWARAGGWIMIVGVAWLTATLTVLVGPHLLHSWMAQASAAIGGLGLGGITSWLGFTPSTAAGRRGDKDAQTQRCSPVKDVLVKIAGPVFLWVLLVLLATFNQNLLYFIVGSRRQPIMHLLWGEMVLLTLFAAIILISSPFVNVNRFSLHAMYRDRLIRTYLGASRPERSETANRFTDFDNADNLNMADLTPARPLHVVNMTLNLVGGNNLAWQQRKAESFTATRLRTGSLRVGYQNTRWYGGKKRGFGEGLSLGSAVAISGAAASPNMGYHSSPLLSMIMTLFNARLGWWLANPGSPGKGEWIKDGPSLAFQPILDEALGRTTDTNKWVYLSDGGHFENLGLYEMVLRRCRTIVVVDGSQDSEYNFEDLGNAIRKVRVDMGVSIEFSGGIPIYSATDVRNRYCALAEIQYPNGEAGKLLYIKACLNGTEPEDVLNYAAVNGAFPQQGTEDLWFDESQFESYRRLGLHIVEKISAAAPASAIGSPIERLFAGAEEYIRSSPAIPSTRWPKPARFSAELAGAMGAANIDLKGTFTASD